MNQAAQQYVPQQYDPDAGLDKAGGIPGVLRLQPGDEVEIVVTGPTLDVMDRFGKKAPTRKTLMGLVIISSSSTSHRPGSRMAVLLSWKSLAEWKAESKRRPFKAHLARYSRVGAKKEDTRYPITCTAPIPPHIAQIVATAGPVEEYGTFERLAAEITRRTEESVKTTPIDNSEEPPKNGAAAAPGAPPYGAGYAGPGTGAGYPSPGNGYPAQGAPPPSTQGYAGPQTSAPVSQPTPQAPPTTVASGALTAADHVAELRKIDGWLQDPRFDVVAGGEHLKAVLFASVGRETVVRFCTQFGVVRGGPPATAAQLRSMVGEALKILAPQTSMAAAIGVPDDGVPF